MRNDDHPLDRAYADLRDAVLRRAAAREVGAEDTARHAPIIIHQQGPTSRVPLSDRAKLGTAATAIVGGLYGLWELYTLFFRR
jgi:hypothetical protein